MFFLWFWYTDVKNKKIIFKKYHLNIISMKKYFKKNIMKYIIKYTIGLWRLRMLQLTTANKEYLHAQN
jgi:hypothetical protein